jgi:putative ubiquitin-RnfH superfamily antitoxin RatB of RatAB toxin-antitoxin module
MALRVDMAECRVGGVYGKFERWEQDLGSRARVEIQASLLEIQASRQFHSEALQNAQIEHLKLLYKL